jgi:hypothetical protein
MAEVVEPREKAVPKYFIKTPEKPEAPNVNSNQAMMIGGAILVAIGVLLVLFGNQAACVGLLGLLGGGVLLWQGYFKKSSAQKAYAEKLKKYEEQYQKAEPKPSDAQMDEWLQKDRERIRVEALKKLDLESSQVVREPIEVIGPANKADLALGKDNVIRFSKYDLVTVYLTDYHLAAYKCTLDMAHGTQTEESTQEYHYKDVVSVATQTGGSDIFAVLLNGEHKSIASYQKFQLAVASGDRIEVAIAFPQLSDIIKDGKLADTGADEAIRVIRSRLREMKGGVQV